MYIIHIPGDGKCSILWRCFVMVFKFKISFFTYIIYHDIYHLLNGEDHMVYLIYSVLITM